MTKKSEAAYIAVFKYIEENIWKLQPKCFMTDYECGMRNALKIVHPKAKLSACWFHYCQAIRRKCSNFGDFLKKVRNDKYADEVFHKVLALPLLPSEHIKNAFEMLELGLKKDAPKYKMFQPMLTYYRKQWLNRVSR